MFDVNTFLSTQVSEKFDSKFAPVPQGYYTAVITDDFNLSEFTSRKGDRLVRFSVTWKPLYAPLAQILGREGATVRQDLLLDVIRDGNGGIRGIAGGPGKNINLGHLREVLGQNTSAPWAPSDLIGKTAVIKVAHRYGVDGTAYAEVKGVYSELPSGAEEGPMQTDVDEVPF